MIKRTLALSAIIVVVGLLGHQPKVPAEIIPQKAAIPEFAWEIPSNMLIDEVDTLLEEQARIRAEEEARIAREQEAQQAYQNLVNQLGYEPSKVVQVNCKITFYYADDNTLQGGYYDKEGVLLKSHEVPVVALPSDVSYGSWIVFDEPVRNNSWYMNVDTGGAIKWLDDNTIVVDVFVPEADSYDELINMVENMYTTATIYYK